jgi:group I intron endonuclease
MACGIYKIENLIDKKTYIGSSVNLENREYKHFWMLDKGFHDNTHLQNSYNKFGKNNFKFDVIEECDVTLLISKENHYINFYESNNQNYGYNMASVNEFRRNTYNDEVKMKLSKFNMIKNGNINKFSLTNIETNVEHIFETLVEGANYLLLNGFANGNPRNVRLKLSNSLRGVKLNNGKNNNGSIRKTCYKHNFKIIN